MVKFDYSDFKFPDRETREYARQERSRIMHEKTKARPGPPILGEGKRPPHWPPLIVVERNGTTSSR